MSELVFFNNCVEWRGHKVILLQFMNDLNYFSTIIIYFILPLNYFIFKMAKIIAWKFAKIIFQT